MNIMTHKIGIGKQLGTIVALVLLIAVLMSAIIPMTNSAYADGEPVKVTVNFYDYGNGNTKGALLQSTQVEPGTMAIPPNNPTQKGMKFLGWDKSYTVPADWNVNESYDICAVYELVMTTEAEDDGELATAKTATPPKEQTVVIANPDGEATTITSEQAIDLNSIIAEEPVPLAANIETEPEVPVVPIVLSIIVALGLIGYIVFVARKKRSQNAA